MEGGDMVGPDSPGWLARAVVPQAGEVAGPSADKPADPELQAGRPSSPSRASWTNAAGPSGLIETSPREAIDLEIVIPALNEERRIGATIEALVAYLERQRYRAALVVVDNGCVDHTADVVA